MFKPTITKGFFDFNVIYDLCTKSKGPGKWKAHKKAEETLKKFIIDLVTTISTAGVVAITFQNCHLDEEVVFSNTNACLQQFHDIVSEIGDKLADKHEKLSKDKRKGTELKKKLALLDDKCYSTANALRIIEEAESLMKRTLSQSNNNNQHKEKVIKNSSKRKSIPLDEDSDENDNDDDSDDEDFVVDDPSDDSDEDDDSDDDDDDDSEDNDSDEEEVKSKIILSNLRKLDSYTLAMEDEDFSHKEPETPPQKPKLSHPPKLEHKKLTPEQTLDIKEYMKPKKLKLGDDDVIEVTPPHILTQKIDEPAVDSTVKIEEIKEEPAKEPIPTGLVGEIKKEDN
jgi:hypothetical protein